MRKLRGAEKMKYEIHAYIPHYYKVIIDATSEDDAVSIANREEWAMLDWEVNPDSWGNYTGEPTVYLTVAVPTEYAE